jgi:hypothetical protein
MPTQSDKTTRNLMWAIVALVAITFTAVVLLATLAPPDRVDNLVVQVLGVLAPTVAILGTLRAVQGVQEDALQTREAVRQVKADTHALTNGLLDAKVRAATSEVLHPDLVDPAYRSEGQAEDLAERDRMDPEQ